MSFTSRLKSSELIKNIMILFSGSAIAQVLPLALTPLLTRLYSPEDFGLLALFISINSVLYVAASFRYETAIMLPKCEKESDELTKLSVLACALFSLIIFLIVLFFSETIADLLGNKEIEFWLFFVPITVFCMGIYRVFLFWHNRYKNYKEISLSKIILHGGGAVSQTSYSGFSGGLIFGYMMGIVFSMLNMLFTFKKKTKMHLRFFFNFDRKLVLVAKKYSRFPKYSLVGAFADNAAAQVPVFILAKFYTEAMVGFFTLATRIVTAPLILFTTAIAQVVYQKVTEMSNDKPEEVTAFVIKGVFTLFVVFLPIVPVMYLWGDKIFSVFFGDQWLEAGNMSVYIAIVAVIKLSISPFSTVLLIANNLMIGVAWQITYLISTISILMIYGTTDITNFFWVYTTHEVVLYLIYFVAILVGSKRLNYVRDNR